MANAAHVSHEPDGEDDGHCIKYKKAQLPLGGVVHPTHQENEARRQKHDEEPWLLTHKKREPTLPGRRSRADSADAWITNGA